jgi:hypothetical protein
MIWDRFLQRVVAANDDAIEGNSNSSTIATLHYNPLTPDPRYWLIVDHYWLQNADSDAGAENPASGLQTDVNIRVRVPAAATGSSQAGTLTGDEPARWYLSQGAPGGRITATVSAAGAGTLTDVAVATVDSIFGLTASDVPDAPSPTAAVSGASVGSDLTYVLVTAFDDLVKPAAGVTGAYNVNIGYTVGCGSLIPGTFAPAAGELAVNEILFDPAPTVALGDSNGDGRRGAYDDEFAEILNISSKVLDLGGLGLFDSDPTLRHRFPCGTILLPGEALVVFGGGRPTGSFGGAVVHTSNLTVPCSPVIAGTPARSLCLGNNITERVILRYPDGGITVTSAPPSNFDTSNPDTSYVRCPSAGAVPAACDAAGGDGGVVYVRHMLLTDGGAPFSPGTRVDGQPFPIVGQSCATALPITAGARTDTTLGYENTYGGTGANCASNVGTPGPDRVYSISVPNNQKLTVTVTPSNATASGEDPAVYLFPAPASSCDGTAPPCLAGAPDTNGRGVAETVQYTNTTGSARTVFIVVDTYYDEYMSYTLQATIGAP